MFIYIFVSILRFNFLHSKHETRLKTHQNRNVKHKLSNSANFVHIVPTLLFNLSGKI